MGWWDGAGGRAGCREQRRLLPAALQQHSPFLRFAFFLHSALHKSIQCDHRAISSPIPAPQSPSPAQREGEHLNTAVLQCARAGQEVLADARAR